MDQVLNHSARSVTSTFIINDLSLCGADFFLIVRVKKCYRRIDASSENRLLGIVLTRPNWCINLAFYAQTAIISTVMFMRENS